MKSIKLSKYFELIKPEYIFIKIISHKSIRNYGGENITKAIAYTYRTINKRIRIEQKKIFFETNFKISYIVDIKNENASFYFMIPKPFKNIILEKISEIWGKATVDILDNIEGIDNTSLFYELSYKYQDALSLSVNKSSNEPLNSILSVMDIMKADDRVTIIYNFMPATQRGWNERYDKTMEMVRNKKILEKESLNAGYMSKIILGSVLNTLDLILEVVNDFLGVKVTGNKESLYMSIMGVLEQQRELSNNTKRKNKATIIPTQIAIGSTSEDSTRKENNILAICQSYRSLDEDNELKYQRCKTKININNYSLGTKTSYISTDEASNFVQIPARTLLERFKINHVNIEENEVPIELRDGYIYLGENTYKGNKIKTYTENDKEIGNLPLMLLGRQGGGKTTFLGNYSNCCIKNNESIVHIDFIRDNESSKDIEKVVDKNKVIILDFSKSDGIQSLAYNEIKFTYGMNWFEKQALANKKTQLTIELVNSINESGEPLSPKMERYLCACTDIVYLNENATFKDVIRCLQDYQYRDEIINNIPTDLKEELEEEIKTLQELDEWSTPKKDKPSEKIGTRDSKIEGILDRVTLLKRDFYLKKMFNMTPENNVDFVEAMENGKAILIRMPQAKFKSYVKNVITTFIVTKCWLACELRGELSERSKRSHIIIDEISQTKTAEKYMESILTQTRKFGMKFVLAGQYLDQLDKKTIYSLKGAGTSFMLLKGAIKEDFEYFKDELTGVFEYDDLKQMQPFSSLNIIQYSKGFSAFITRLPKPVYLQQ